ncbi:MAG: ATP-dependent DNA helicase [Promethearchaeota archaeon]
MSNANSSDAFIPTDEQQAAIDHFQGNVQILACAGSGKTAVVAQRIAQLLEAHEEILPKNIVAFTFTVKAAEEMEVRIKKYLTKEINISEMFIGTIHSFCYELLKKADEEFEDTYQILDENQQYLVLFKNYEALNLADLKISKSKSITIERVIKNINVIKDEMIPDSDLEAKNQKIYQIYKKYNAILEENNYLDFGDLISKSVELLQTDKNFLEAVQNQYLFLFVDEYQDINNTQDKLIKLLNAHNNLCVVGDDDQCIYQFRGSNLKYILEFQQSYEGVSQYPLYRNFRSNKPIVKVANRCIGKIDKSNRIPKQMYTEKDDRGEVQAKIFDDINDEIDFIISKINDLVKTEKIRYSQIALLFRSVKSSAEPFIRAFKRRNLPFIVIGAAGLFKYNPEVRLIHTILEFCITKPDKSGKKLLNQLIMEGDELFYEKYLPDFIETITDIQKDPSLITLGDISFGKLGEKFKQPTYKMLNKLIDLRTQVLNEEHSGLLRLFYDIVGALMFFELDDSSDEDVESIMYNLASFSQLIADYESIIGGRSVKFLLGFIKSYAEKNYDETVPRSDELNKINIMTVHQAKGLEFDTIFIPYLEKGIFPNTKAPDPWLVDETLFPSEQYAQTEENERRLFYVALTRAERNLYLTACQDVHKKRRKRPSPFILEFQGLDQKTYKPIELSTSSRREFLKYSFSKIEYYLVCPYRYKLHFEYQFTLPGDNIFFQYGRAIHRILSILHKAYLTEKRILSGTEVEAIFNRIYNVKPYGPFREAQINKWKIDGILLMKKYLTKYSDLIEKTYASELDFFYLLTPDDGISGKIDLILQQAPDSFHIIDFKTDRKIKDLARKKVQLELYALVCKDFLNLNVDKVSLLFFQLEKSWEEIIQHKDYERIRSDILEILGKIRTREFPPSNGRHCKSRCDFGRMRLCRYLPKTRLR